MPSTDCNCGSKPATHTYGTRDCKYESTVLTPEEIAECLGECIINAIKSYRNRNLDTAGRLWPLKESKDTVEAECMRLHIPLPGGWRPADTLAKVARDALLVQDACNLSGVVRSFAGATEVLWAEARRQGKGTEFVNTHPISVLYANKIESLTRATEDSVFSEAYNAVQKLAGG